MLLQLPPEVQREVLGNLTTGEMLQLREASRQCCDMVADNIRDVTLTSCCDVKKALKAFPCLTGLTIQAQCDADMIALHLAMLWQQKTFQLIPQLSRLTIVTDENSRDTIPCAQLQEATAESASLRDVELSSFVIDLTASTDAFLTKLTSLRARWFSDPDYPPRCFLCSGILSARRLASCANLTCLQTYVRTTEDFDEIMNAVEGSRSIRFLDIRAQGHAVSCRSNGSWSGNSRKPLEACAEVKLVNFEPTCLVGALAPFPNAHTGIFGVLASSNIYLAEAMTLSNLQRLWLLNVQYIDSLRCLPALSTLSLNYDNYANSPDGWQSPAWEELAWHPNLRRLEITNIQIHPHFITDCARLQEVALSDVSFGFSGRQPISSPRLSVRLDYIYRTFANAGATNPGGFIRELTCSGSLHTIWYGAHHTQYPFCTSSFDFHEGSPASSWRGRFCRNEIVSRWFFPSPATSPSQIGLELTRSEVVQQPQ